MLFQNQSCGSVMAADPDLQLNYKLLLLLILILILLIILILILILTIIIIIIANITMEQLKWEDVIIFKEPNGTFVSAERNTSPNTEVLYYVALTSIELLHIFC